ncbi:MAG: zinc ribbon domain-containing protein [Pyrinomonadaceae bacterium]
MYCPKCSAQNENEQKYCRRCGLPLSILNLAIEGRVDEAVPQYKKGGDSLSGSTITLGLCLIGALINLLLVPAPWNVYAVVANSIIGLVIALPMIITGHVRLSRAKRLLSLEDPILRSIKAESHRTATLLPPAAVTDPLLSPGPIPSSVTEQTTLNLKSPERKH